jgi:hypothetical protein
VPGVIEPTVSCPSPSTIAATVAILSAATSIRERVLRRVQRARPCRFLSTEVSTRCRSC